ncbi:ABC transporter permease subunit [Roseovarius faecimaris]|uniref:ABC transporter permease subunit n=1 Tax=Roseovarius faecimaris TaxID=2494550 RepID=A0A6I6IMD7_9RHOB|nr:ABC transporter permease subunit [Roseovarius faecimaris]QGX98260.1 ABC transporter permease subunit [Roseovarius faecimaris]
MSDPTELKVTAASDIEVDREALDASIKNFAGPNGDYYVGTFHKIHDNTGLIPKTFNWAAALFGPLWAASRAVWGMFWIFLILEIIAWVQIGRGWWGNLGAEFMDRVAQQTAKMQERLDQAAAATEQADIDRFTKLAENLQKSIDLNLGRAEAAQAEGFGILVGGVILLVALKLIQGVYADIAYEKQYSRWRIDPDSTESGRKTPNAVLGAILTAAIGPLIVYKFTVANSMPVLDEFPERPVSEIFTGEGGSTLFSVVASWLEARIDAAALAGGDVFDGIVSGVRTVLDALTLALNGSPWPVVMLVIAVTAWRAAGPRVAIFTVAAMAYTALLGYWSLAMETVALVGAAVLLCVVIGIPLGIWFGKSKRAYRMAEPVLDLMQTLPAFVYLIPIIAFFGTGNTPGILATIIFGMPPVIRLTALGMRGVPDSIKEAAVAFGASKWQLLKDVEVPLALPSIMTGVNQTILMCLSMVVIISLIGGGGLGKEILEALQYAAKGPGLLGGFAILFLAMVMDRIVQGAFRRKDQED